MTPSLGLALACVGSFALGAVWARAIMPGIARRAIERAYDAGFEDGREVIAAPEPRARLVAVSPPPQDPPNAVVVADVTDVRRPYLDWTPYAARPDIGRGWQCGVIWSPPWDLVGRLPAGSWLRALLAEATTMPPHRPLP